MVAVLWSLQQILVMLLLTCLHNVFTQIPHLSFPSVDWEAHVASAGASCNCSDLLDDCHGGLSIVVGEQHLTKPLELEFHPLSVVCVVYVRQGKIATSDLPSVIVDAQQGVFFLGGDILHVLEKAANEVIPICSRDEKVSCVSIRVLVPP